VWSSWIEEARKNASGGKASRPLGVRPSWYMDFDVREMAKRFLREEVTKAGVGGSKLLFQTDAQLEAEARVSHCVGWGGVYRTGLTFGYLCPLSGVFRNIRVYRVWKWWWFTGF